MADTFDEAAAEFLDIEHRLHRVPREAMPRARQAMKKALIDIQAGAMLRAPVDTGYLREHIIVRTQGNGAFAKGWVGATANYAEHVENGTRKMRAQPFLRPATDIVLPGYEASMEQLVAELIEEG